LFGGFVVLSFKKFLINEDSAGAKRNAAGVLHELLTAKHLNGGKHPDQHRSEEGLTPEKAHDKYKSLFSDHEYSAIDKRAKAAAADLHKIATKHGPIHKVTWTSKPGDVEKVTGVKSTQAEDPSDIIVSTKHSKTGEIHHHTISLKVSKHTPSTHIATSNKGAEATLGGGVHHEAYKKAVLDAHPELKKATNKPARKEWLSKNPTAAKSINSDRTKMLHTVAKHVTEKLGNMDKKDLSDHIRHHVLRAVPTPSELAGHSHIKHTTYRDGQTHSANPATHYDHMLNDHENLSVEHRGTGVIFKHKGKAFASQKFKTNSTSDPLSTLNSIGSTMGSTH
jgi:hypothetical protein